MDFPSEGVFRMDFPSEGVFSMDFPEENKVFLGRPIGTPRHTWAVMLIACAECSFSGSP